MVMKIWHNSRCSKSREALRLLEEKGVNIEVFNYLTENLNEEKIKIILLKLGISAMDLMRKKEDKFKELNLQNVTDETVLIKAMVEFPKLIERPIIITDNKAIIGRPPELVLEL